ncbi:MAG TPA: hypothetical protein VFR44_13490 [Actinomycetota bacterium]|nr:hypothetical protein [Actinomycetota bacterium]
MEDFTALAGTLSESVGDARGVLILSSDGLVLGTHPADAETSLKSSWVRFAGLGEPTRGFVQFGTEIWCHVRRGPYSAFVVTGVGVRPGLVIDQIETALLAAEEARAHRESPRAAPSAAPPAAPSGRPRAPLHREGHAADVPTIVIHADDPPPPVPSEDPRAVPRPAAAEAPSAPPEPSGDPNVWGQQGGQGEGQEVDRFSLAREFSQLLQEDQGAADG